MDIGPTEIQEAIEVMGDGKHSMKDIENQIVINRHNKKKEESRKRKCRKSTKK